MIHEIRAAIRFEADLRKMAETAAMVDWTRRRILVYNDHMLKSFARCEATAVPEVIEDECNQGRD